MYRPIEIILADDHEIFRDGFGFLFKKSVEIKLVGEAVNGKDMVKMAHELNPDIVITDLHMPLMDGIEATRVLTKELPHIGIIALTMFNEENQVVEMLEAGAKGYLSKNAHKSEIIAAIKAVNKDQNYYCRLTTPKLAKLIAHSNFAPVNNKNKPDLSEKEMAVMRLICQEFSNKEIAEQMGLSRRTIEWHREIIAEKIQAKNTAGIVIYAVRNKIFELAK